MTNYLPLNVLNTLSSQLQQLKLIKEDKIRKYLGKRLKQHLKNVEGSDQHFWVIDQINSLMDFQTDHTGKISSSIQFYFHWNKRDAWITFVKKKRSSFEVSFNARDYTIKRYYFIHPKEPFCKKKLIPEEEYNRMDEFGKWLDDNNIISSSVDLIRFLYHQICRFPILETQESCFCLLMIRWFRDSIFSCLPKDVMKIIVKMIWNERYQDEFHILINSSK